MRNTGICLVVILLFSIGIMLSAHAESGVRTMEFYQAVQKEMQAKVSAGGWQSFAITKSDPVVWGNWQEIENEVPSFSAPPKQLIAGGDCVVFLLESGEIRYLSSKAYYSKREQSVANVKMLAITDSTLFALQEDGAVECLYNSTNAFGNPRYEHIEKWHDIEAIIGGDTNFLLGLSSDGKVVMDGDTGWKLNSQKWKNIVQIAAGYNSAIGLKDDGTVVAAGTYVGLGITDEPKPPKPDYDVSGWKDIVQVVAGDNIYVGLKADGTICLTGWGQFTQYVDSALEWEDVVYITGTWSTLVGVQSDGTILSTKKVDVELDKIDIRTPLP